MVGGENNPVMEIDIYALVFKKSRLVIVIYWDDVTPVHEIVVLLMFVDSPKHGRLPDMGS